MVRVKTTPKRRETWDEKVAKLRQQVDQHIAASGATNGRKRTPKRRRNRPPRDNRVTMDLIHVVQAIPVEMQRKHVKIDGRTTFNTMLRNLKFGTKRVEPLMTYKR